MVQLYFLLSDLFNLIYYFFHLFPYVIHKANIAVDVARSLSLGGKERDGG